MLCFSVLVILILQDSNVGMLCRFRQYFGLKSGGVLEGRFPTYSPVANVGTKMFTTIVIYHRSRFLALFWYRVARKDRRMMLVII